MITVIIPVLNEENTITSVVEFCLKNSLVSEILVVDDNSEDNTAKLAQEAGAKVIQSKVRGKGISMRDGVRNASNELLVFLDGDIYPYPDQTIEKLTLPLLTDHADFVKGAFARNAGRVTELVAKPLLNILYPGLSNYSQPLSGMIAGKRAFFQKIEIFNDYGADIGILIDMYLIKARIVEVNIGYIENKSKPWQALGKMSKEVSHAIISKAHRLNPEFINEEEMISLETINREMNNTLREELSVFRKMVAFDMDDTILKGRFIDECSRQFGFTDRLDELRSTEKDPIILTKRIGLLLKGRTIDDLLHVVSGIEVVPDVRSVVQALKAKNYLVGIISNSYALITNYVRQQVGADFSFANKLEMYEGRATGEVNLPSYFFASSDSICGHAYCKTNALQCACEKYHVLLKNCIVIGDNADDRCMVSNAGKGVAFRTKDKVLESVANLSIQEDSFTSLLQLT